MKSFDAIDIIFILLISTYLVVLFVFVLWIILCKIEQREIAKKGRSKLSANTTVKDLKILEKSTPENDIKRKKTRKKTPAKKPNTSKSNNKSTIKANKTNSSKAKNKKANTTKKKTNNSSNRNNGYVSPTKRKKNNAKRKSHK